MQGSILAAASGQSGIWMSRSYTLKFVHRLSSPEKTNPARKPAGMRKMFMSSCVQIAQDSEISSGSVDIRQTLSPH